MELAEEHSDVTCSFSVASQSLSSAELTEGQPNLAMEPTARGTGQRRGSSRTLDRLNDQQLGRTWIFSGHPRIKAPDA